MTQSKKLTADAVAYVANELKQRLEAVKRKITVEYDDNPGNYRLVQLRGKDLSAAAGQIIALINRYRPAAAAYLMRAHARQGNIDDATEAGRLAKHKAEHSDIFYDAHAVKIRDYGHGPTRKALVRFLQPKINALVQEENARRQAALDEYVERIKSEMIPPDPDQSAESDTRQVMAIPEPATEDAVSVSLPDSLDE